MSQTDQTVVDYLLECGLDRAVAEQGVGGLVERWEQIVSWIQDGYDLTIDDYLNDMDLRQLLDRSWELASPETQAAWRTRLTLADDRFKAETETSPPLWGESVTEEEGYSPDRQFWFFRRPRRPGPTLTADLRLDGLL
jgi:hypothetical protein